MTQTESPFCSIVIPAFNESEHIEKTLESLSNQNYPEGRYEIIVVDNGSTDDTVEIARKWATKTLTKEKCNVGGVRNFGVSNANGEIIVTTDADCTFPENWLKNGVEKINNHEDLIAGGGLRTSPSAKWLESLWILNPNGATVQQKDLMGSCIFVRKSTFKELGGFPEDITSGEDSSFSEKARRAGYTVELFPDLSIYHLGTPKTIKEFILRQAWHGENAHPDIRSTFTDKVFLATLIYLILIALSITNIWNTYFYVFFSASQIIAASLSVKRTRRAKFRPSVSEMIQLVIIDNFYLIGRTIGIFRVLKNKLLTNTK